MNNRLFIAFICASFLSILLQWCLIFGLTDSDTAHVVDFALYIIPLIYIFTLWYKMPKFLDLFLIVNELKWIVINYIIALIINISLLITFMFADLGYTHRNNILWNLCVLYVYFIDIFQTQYLIYLLQLKKFSVL